MNREQMIAWLTLEGWEPMKSKPKSQVSHWLYRNGVAVYVALNGDEAERTNWNNTGVHPYATWEEYPEDQLKWVYKEIINHEPR